MRKLLLPVALVVGAATCAPPTPRPSSATPSATQARDEVPATTPRRLGTAGPRLNGPIEGTIELSVQVDPEGRPVMSSLRMEGVITTETRIALTRWIDSTRFAPATRGGASVEGTFRTALESRRGPDGSPGYVMRGSNVTRFPAQNSLRAFGVGAMAQLAPKVHRLAASLDTLWVAVGDTLTFQQTLYVFALDSAGTLAGLLPIFDTRLAGRVAGLNGVAIIGREVGQTELEISFPRAMWTGRSDPPPTVTVPVRVMASRMDPSVRARRYGALWGTSTGSSNGCNISPFVECLYRHWIEGEGRAAMPWLQFVVIYRLDPPDFDRLPYATDAAGRDVAMRVERDRSDDARRRGREWSGTSRADLGTIGYESIRPADSIFVEGVAIAVPQRKDSALAVLVDARRGTADSMRVRFVRLPATMPDSVIPRAWSSGDTTLMLRQKTDRQWLRTALLRVPLIAEFVR